jgi:hypothetical protein
MATIEYIQGIRVLTVNGDVREVLDEGGIMPKAYYAFPKEEFGKIVERRKGKLSGQNIENSVEEYH